VREVSLEVRPGELVTIAGVEGSGQRELLRALAGITPLRAGERVVQEPVVLIPEDRTTEGLILSLDLAANVALGMGRSAPWVRRGWLDWKAVRSRTQELVEAFDVRTPSVRVPAASLSGGNQQKLVIARALAREPAVLIAENPTRGLDIRATGFVHQQLREAAARGIAVIVSSSDLDEVLELGQRVLVMARGALVEMKPGAGRAEVGAAMVGGL
jgi:simple sugar transport system ATP-binding protein